MDNFEIFTFLKLYFKEILSLLGGIGMFFLGKTSRKKAIQEADARITSSELDSVETALKIYRVMLEDLQLKFTEVQQAYALLEARFQVAVKKNKEYDDEVNDLKERLEKCNDK